MTELLRAMPKVELHCHFDGSVPMDTVYELGEEIGLTKDYLSQIPVTGQCENLEDYLKSFDIILQVLQTKDHLQRAAYATIKRIASEGVKYLELRFAPLLHLEKGLTISEVIDSVIEGLLQATSDFDIQVNLIISAMRNQTDEMNLSLVDAIQELNSPELVGFDFAGPEPDGANDDIQHITNKMKDKDFHLTLHSGECGCAHNVVQAIKLGATRIGHGIAIADDPEVMKFVSENNVLLEVCPTSNYQTSGIKTLAAFPARTLMDANVKFSVSCDNRTVSDTSLINEYQILIDYHKFTIDELVQTNRDGIHASFANEAMKANLTEQLNEFHNKLNETH
ncbi:adenosine deaminase [Aerococcaceae bacterium DSM 111176]|nr:adenosine deaminase [Aerococcaceae bacterium DSM 111176]